MLREPLEEPAEPLLALLHLLADELELLGRLEQVGPVEQLLPEPVEVGNRAGRLTAVQLRRASGAGRCASVRPGAIAGRRLGYQTGVGQQDFQQLPLGGVLAGRLSESVLRHRFQAWSSGPRTSGPADVALGRGSCCCLKRRSFCNSDSRAQTVSCRRPRRCERRVTISSRFTWVCMLARGVGDRKRPENIVHDPPRRLDVRCGVFLQQPVEVEVERVLRGRQRLLELLDTAVGCDSKSHGSSPCGNGRPRSRRRATTKSSSIPRCHAFSPAVSASNTSTTFGTNRRSWRTCRAFERGAHRGDHLRHAALVGHHHVGVALDDREVTRGRAGVPGQVEAVKHVALREQRRLSGVVVFRCPAAVAAIPA